jgi:SprT protein
MPSHLIGNRKQAILAEVSRFYSLMESPPAPEIRLDLRGRAAGQWRVQNGIEMLRFNPEAFLLDWDAHFPATVAHEVAHSLVYRRYGTGRVRPHGREWRDMMAALGFPPAVTHRTQLTGRRSRVYVYECKCRSHRLGPRQHYLVTRRGYRYNCLACGSRLHFNDHVEWK